ncbi:MAG: alanine racemase [Thermodesulfovibrionales bacterium]|nr:alanine racemase [Thermodesulfovibrionales bacterium]
MQRGLVAEIDIGALLHNLSVVRQIANTSDIIAVVKADAYGHGAVEISHALVNQDVNTLAVAFTSEAVQLRQSGINAKILSLFDHDVSDVFKYNITPVVSTITQAISLDKEASKRDVVIPVHLKIDTGMGRTGLCYEQIDDIKEVFYLKNLIVEGIMSHFADADASDKSYALQQIKRLKQVNDTLLNNGITIRYWHIANSAAILTIKDSILNAVRPGIMLYGYCTINHNYQLKPVMSIKTHILQIRHVKNNSPISYNRTYYTKRDSLIAVIPAGYADCINRRFSNNMEVLVRGKRAPVVGVVCMDLTMIDVTDIPSVKEGDEVVILGEQGNDKIDANELSKRIDTIPYEILTAFGMRARRIYKKSSFCA